VCGHAEDEFAAQEDFRKDGCVRIKWTGHQRAGVGTVRKRLHIAALPVWNGYDLATASLAIGLEDAAQAHFNRDRLRLRCALILDHPLIRDERFDNLVLLGARWNCERGADELCRHRTISLVDERQQKIMRIGGDIKDQVAADGCQRVGDFEVLGQQATWPALDGRRHRRGVRPIRHHE